MAKALKFVVAFILFLVTWEIVNGKPNVFIKFRLRNQGNKFAPLGTTDKGTCKWSNNILQNKANTCTGPHSHFTCSGTVKSFSFSSMIVQISGVCKLELFMGRSGRVFFLSCGILQLYISNVHVHICSICIVLRHEKKNTQLRSKMFKMENCSIYSIMYILWNV